jgi:hypothetical protein
MINPAIAIQDIQHHLKLGCGDVQPEELYHGSSSGLTAHGPLSSLTRALCIDGYCVQRRRVVLGNGKERSGSRKAQEVRFVRCKPGTKENAGTPQNQQCVRIPHIQSCPGVHSPPPNVRDLETESHAFLPLLQSTRSMLPSDP